MHVTRRTATLLREALDEWVDEGHLTDADRNRLRKQIHVTPFDWHRLARYAIRLSLACLVIAVVAAFTDDWLRDLLAWVLEWPRTVQAATVSLGAAGLYVVALWRRQRMPDRTYSVEALFFLGVLTTGCALVLWADAFSADGPPTYLLLIASILYGVLGLAFPSGLVWVFALCTLGGWFGAQTGYVSGWGAYYFGMNYPLRFVGFGAILTLLSTLFRFWPSRSGFLRSTRIVGLLYLFMALWILSIFGNYGSLETWEQVPQWTLLPWSLLFGVVALVAIGHGLWQDDPVTRGFGLTFLLINLYTRFFEFFWEGMPKALFFAVLALSFWFIGTRAEAIWTLQGLRSLRAPEEPKP